MPIHLRGKNITLQKVLTSVDESTRRTKIICTMGPACWSVENILCLIDSGMNVARLNFSHGDHVSHAATLQRIRAAERERPGVHVAIMLDTKGPEIRTGFLEEGKSIKVMEGQQLEITTDYSIKGNSSIISCSYPSLPQSVSVGSRILIADGTLTTEVTEIKEKSVVVRVLNTCSIGERKNMNLPGVIVDLPTVTDQDIDDIVNFGVRYGVDMIAASFVRKASDIDVIRNVLGPAGKHIKIIAKIENQEGLQNYDAILEKVDGIMVARGDLGMEIPIEKVFQAQKMMIRKANIAGKPVITATQMLESMITNARPTRAECSDVANAVLDGSDCVMLSGETANGAHFEAAVRFMGRTCAEAESIINYSQLFSAMRESTFSEVGTITIPEAVASSAVKTALDLHAKAIIVCSETGNTARLVCKYRPPMPVLVLTATDFVGKQVTGLCRGAHCIVMGTMIGTDTIVTRATDMMKDWGWVKEGDCVVAIHGQIEGRPGSTSLCRVLSVS